MQIKTHLKMCFFCANSKKCVYKQKGKPAND